MGWIEIVVIIFAVALVAFTVIYNVLRRKKGRNCCGGGCSGCSGCSGCPYSANCSAKPQERKEEKSDSEESSETRQDD